MKSKTVKIRLSPEEKRAFEKSAEVAGISLSSWMRERLRRMAVAELREIGELASFLNHSE